MTASGSRAGLTARPAPSEPYVQVSPHTAQASASACEVDRGASRTAPAVDENTGRSSGGGVAAHHDIGVTALVAARIEDRPCSPRTGPRGGPWRIGYSTLIHQVTW